MLQRQADRGWPEWPDGGHCHTGSDIRSGIDGSGYGISEYDHDGFGHDDGYGISEYDHDAFGHDDGYGISEYDHDGFGHDDG
ncbi:MAG: hypothetical protein VX321_06145 [Actinomycetota bacterium]|nr:hypothetical protein [Actinomycetota bacterium]